jgi:hypothetical protein
VAIPSRAKRSVASLKSSVASGNAHFSSSNGFVASPKGVTDLYPPFSTLRTIACREKRRRPERALMSGYAFLLKSNGAYSGRLTGGAF